jgi:TRAP-type mannitol/chloroaromatic compound transport system permease small subunit
MIGVKLLGTVFFVLPQMIRRANISWRYFILYSLFEPTLLALATGMVCYWQYYFLRGQMHELFLLALAGVSGVLIYFPALYFMMFDHAEKMRINKLVGKVTGKLRRA